MNTNKQKTRTKKRADINADAILENNVLASISQKN